MADMMQTSSETDDVKALDRAQASYGEKALDRPHSMELGAVAKPPLKPFTVLTAMTMGYSISNSGLGMILIVGNTVFGAGPLFIYGTILVTMVTFCVAITLGELASAYPHSGGQYFWTAQLAPEKYRRFMSYMTAVLSWGSVICTSASACAALVNTIFQIVALNQPDFVYKQWMGFLVYVGVNWLATAAVVFERFIPILSNTFVFVSVSVILSLFIALLVSSTPKAPSSLVWGADGYYNVSGWPDGVSFLIGISGINWGFSCLDAATHLAEEIPQPRKNIPKALLWTVFMGFIVAFPINVALFYKAVDLSTTTSIIEVISTSYNGSTIAPTALGAFIIFATFGSVVGTETWQSRIVWSLSRDKGFPFHSRMSRMAPSPFNTPLWAILWGSAWITLCGFLYLGSTTAFNSFISAGIVLQYITYATPAVLLLIKGRGNLPRGPFYWPKFGPIANLVVISWTIVITVFYCFPLFLPVYAGSMNYLACVLAFAFLYAGAYWVLYGHKHYRLVDLAAILD